MKLDELIALLKSEHKIDVAALQDVATKHPTLQKDFDDYKKAHPEKKDDPTPIEKDPAFIALKDAHTKTTEANTALLQRVNAAETETKKVQDQLRKDAAIAKVDLLVKDGKIKPVDKDTYVEMAEKQPDMFEKISKTLTVVVDLTERGSSINEPVLTKKLSESEIKTTVDSIVANFGIGKKK